MKRLFFVLSFLFFAVVCFSQTVYKLPYDTVVVMKPSGIGYLKGYKGYFGDTIWFKTVDTSTNSTVGATTEFVHKLLSGFSGGGNPNSNVGSGYRWAIPNTNNIKTYLAGYGLVLDSATLNSIKTTVDTNSIATISYVNNHSGTTLTRQVITSSSPATVSGGNYLVTINFGSTQSSFVLTMPSAPVDKDIVNIEVGGTLTNGMSVNSFTLLPNTSQSIIGSLPMWLQVGDFLSFEYRAVSNQWYIH